MNQNYSWDDIRKQVGKIVSEKGKYNKFGTVCGNIAIPVFEYKDEIVEIAAHSVTSMFEIRRVENNNPVIMADEHGMNFRYHGEFIHIRNHFFGL